MAEQHCIIHDHAVLPLSGEKMNYGNIKYHATEDGPGCRTVLFVSGCRHRCKGCFQPQTWNFDFGEKFTKETENAIIESLKDSYVSGLTLLGGEPFEPENQKVLAGFIRQIKDLMPEKSIWTYTGCTFEQLLDESSPYHTNNTLPMLKTIDILVDGEFIEEKKNLMLAFRGSENQRIIDVKQSLIEGRTVNISEKYDRH
jgi:anaerobic ribonucleoside-triphosphate reductase activating protein